MHYLVGVSQFAKYGTNRLLIVWEMLTKLSKKTLFRNGEDNEKVIRNPHADPDHHQKSTTCRGSPLAHACQVWSTSVSAFVSYPVYRMTEWQTERPHNLRLVGGRNNNANGRQPEELNTVEFLPRDATHSAVYSLTHSLLRLTSWGS